jgi:hypothetical protein
LRSSEIAADHPGYEIVARFASREIAKRYAANGELLGQALGHARFMTASSLAT